MEGSEGEARPLKTYRIEIRRSAARSLEKLPKADQLRIARDIDLLSTDPRPAGRAKQLDRDVFRIRTGRYRTIYQVHDADCLLRVLVIGHRRLVYDEFDRRRR